MRKLTEIDMIRAIACLSVVYNHVITNYQKFSGAAFVETTPFLFIRYAFLFATPIFILISITLLARSYPDKLPKGFLWSRFKYIFVPYALIGLFSAYTHSLRSETPFLEIAWNVVGLGDWHGFFILVIFQFYVLYYVLNRPLRKINPWIAIIVSFLITFSHLYAIENAEAYRQFIFTEYPLWYRTHIFAWISYFTAGFYIGVYYDQLAAFAHKWIIGLAAFAAAGFGWIFYNVQAVGYTDVSSDRYDMFFYTIAVFFLLVVVFQRSERPHPLLEIVGSFSFFIYLSHMTFILGLSRIINVFNDSFILYTASLLLFTVGICIGVGALLYLHRWSQWITGRNRLLDRLLPRLVSKME